MRALERHIVSGADLLSAHGADLTVDGDLACLDALLGLAAGGHQIGEIQQVLKLDEFCLNYNIFDLFTPCSSAAPAGPCRGSFPHPLWER